jgi:hypothetical protein
VTTEKKTVLIILLAALAGCSSRKEAVTAEKFLSADDVIAAVNAQSSSIQTFSAVGSLNIETPRMSQSAGFDLAVKKANSSAGSDSIRISVEGPFGITFARVLFTTDRFIAYNALNNTLYTGDPKKGLQSVPLLSNIETAVVVDALSGLRRFDHAFFSPDSFYTTASSYFFHFTSEDVLTAITVDASSMRISKVKTYDMKGTLLWEEDYSYTQFPSGAWKPETARITVPARSTSIEFYFDEVTINAPLSSLSITYPDDAERISIN